MPECLFCQIRDGELPAEIIYTDEQVIAFRDINPQAPLHALIVPRQHIPSLNDLQPEHDGLVGHLHRVAARLAADAGVADKGYRVLFNCNRGAGQTVYHLHLHVLGGRLLRWPPG
ncbi:MAG TPA: histidine triad nucleotide-binding protein [Polyangia bacterium]|jgi:histidine triad (HIT) family protein